MSERGARACCYCTLAVVLLVFANRAAARQALPTREYVATVSRVIDGDTIVVGTGLQAISVRLRCVDTPEVARAGKPAQPFGVEATRFTRAALVGQQVRLIYHRREPFDRYARLLAYVFDGNGKLFNAELVRQGLARSTRFKCLYRDQIKALEREARQQRRGLWGR